MRHLLSLTGYAAVLTMLASAAQIIAPQTFAPQALAQSAPAPAATLNPAGEGRRLYLKLNCYGCHGMRAAGGMGPRIVGSEAQDVMREGGSAGMPSYSKYATAKDVANINAYLLSIENNNDPKFTHWWEPIPTK